MFGLSLLSDGYKMKVAPVDDVAGPAAKYSIGPAAPAKTAVRPHLKLGITCAGAKAFLESGRLAKYGYRPSWQKSYKDDNGKLVAANVGYMGGSNWPRNEKVTEIRQRNKHPIDPKDPPPEFLDGTYPEQLTCYDLNIAIRNWLRDTGNEDKSVCEVLQAEGFTEPSNLGPGCPVCFPRLAVGEAKAFQSHVQCESPEEMFDSMDSLSLGRAGIKPGSPIWVDSFSIRQCQPNEFIPEEVVALIGEIGTTYAVMDKKGTYTARTFCMLEAYATVHHNSRLRITRMVNSPYGGQSFIRAMGDSLCCCWVCDWEATKVDSANAQTRSREDKELIDE